MKRRIRSDACDAGNRLTQFYEVNEICPLCDGFGKITGIELYKKLKYINSGDREYVMDDILIQSFLDEDGEIIEDYVEKICPLCGGDKKISYIE